jgi:class 3 adenylate cyclase
LCVDKRAHFSIHIGNVTAGVIGKTKFAFDIWGDTVNVASRMESSGVPMEIHITEEVADLIEDKSRCQYRGEVEIKGKGLMKTYIINRYN